MTSVCGPSSIACPAALTAGSPSPPANASGELARLEVQLADWVHCPSGKTSAGKQKIAEISDKIALIKAQVEKARNANAGEVSAGELRPSEDSAQSGLRFNGRGAWLNLQA